MIICRRLLEATKNLPELGTFQFGLSESGWMKAEILFEYVSNVLYPNLKKLGIQFPSDSIHENISSDDKIHTLSLQEFSTSQKYCHVLTKLQPVDNLEGHVNLSKQNENVEAHIYDITILPTTNTDDSTEFFDTENLPVIVTTNKDEVDEDEVVENKVDDNEHDFIWDSDDAMNTKEEEGNV
ncbi:hypothetical protein ILUMI_22888 [Ignelater luminosus]|uniref:Uncharacterized protein n=1 Tax=Ignelater luminosus TaxID=2038154 RepID=A0A8K0CD05_IGNLU|nr:hypothetical protein ILUMI_22888 [Ignelater luminosus]